VRGRITLRLFLNVQDLVDLKDLVETECSRLNALVKGGGAMTSQSYENLPTSDLKKWQRMNNLKGVLNERR
jgi:hypothetical protein